MGDKVNFGKMLIHKISEKVSFADFGLKIGNLSCFNKEMTLKLGM